MYHTTFETRRSHYIKLLAAGLLAISAVHHRAYGVNNPGSSLGKALRGKALLLQSIVNSNQSCRFYTLNFQGEPAGLRYGATEMHFNEERRFFAENAASSFESETESLAASDPPQERVWRVRGQHAPELRLFDDAMETFMKSNEVRAGQLAISKEGRLMLAKGYTWAQASHPPIEAADCFRIAHCGMPLTSLLIHQLIEEGKLYLDTRAQEVLLLATPSGGSPSSDFKNVQVKHLLAHLSGYGEPPPLASLEAAFGESAPSRRKWLSARYLSQYNPFQTPGDQFHFSSFGFEILELIAEKKIANVFGDFERIAKARLFAPLGIDRPHLLCAEHSLSETCEQCALASGSLHWAMAAADYVKLLAAFDLGRLNPVLSSVTAEWGMWGYPGTGPASLRHGWFEERLGETLTAVGHVGEIADAQACIWRRSDKISFALFLDGSQSEPLRLKGCDITDALNETATRLASWPQHDLFPALGLPSFKQLYGAIEDRTIAENPDSRKQPIQIDLLTPDTNVIKQSFTVESGHYTIYPTISDGIYDVRFHTPAAIKRVKNVEIQNAALLNVSLCPEEKSDADFKEDFLPKNAP